MSAPAQRCVLHVAALPFPSCQGTQGAIRAMMEAATRAGQRAELFSYATSGYPLSPSFPLHRTGNFPRVRSLRSGPSLRKVLLDARMLWELRTLIHRLRPSCLVAHHVEAATLSLALHSVPTVFFAHTDLAAELPSYAGARSRALLSWAGGTLDRFLTQRADAVATISPMLCGQLSSIRPDCVYVPTPWSLPEPIARSEREASRRALELAADSCVALYAGNLDAYQDVDSVLLALHRLLHAGTRIVLLLATHSPPRRMIARAIQLGVPFRTSRLDDERLRRLTHAAADLAIIPRAVPGGLPIKLLDALARGVPCAVSPFATAGIALGDCVRVARAQTAEALADAAAPLAHDTQLRHMLATRGRAYIARAHNEAIFVTALNRAQELAINTWSSTRAASVAFPRTRHDIVCVTPSAGAARMDRGK